MAWTSPMTAIAGSVFTAAQFNTFVRDNLAETAPAKATTPGGYFAVSDTNQVAERVSDFQAIDATGTTTSTSFTDLDSPAAVGPSVTVTTGPRALVVVSGTVTGSGTGSSRMCYEVSGATSIAAADTRGIATAVAASVVVLGSNTLFHEDLTPGSNTFTCKYRVSASTGSFGSRKISVLPF